MKLAQSNVQRVEHLAATPIATTTTQNQISLRRPIWCIAPHRWVGSSKWRGCPEPWRCRYGQDLQGHASFKASNARYAKL